MFAQYSDDRTTAHGQAHPVTACEATVIALAAGSILVRCELEQGHEGAHAHELPMISPALDAGGIAGTGTVRWLDRP